MIRNLIAVAGAAFVAGSASAAFIGIEVREDKTLDPADLAVIDPGGMGFRVFNFYAKFDEQVVEDVQDPASANTVISIGQPDAVSNFRINKETGNAGASFYQNAGNGNLPPNSVLVDLVPGLAEDTYVGIGNKANLNGISDTTGTDPDFGITADAVFGGWFNSGGSNFQGGANAGTFNAAKGTWDVFIGQFGILGLDAGVSSGEGDGLNGNADTTWHNDVFKGSFTLFTQTPGGGATPHNITFAKIPTPGTLALFGVAGLAAGRRRRA